MLNVKFIDVFLNLNYTNTSFMHNGIKVVYARMATS